MTPLTQAAETANITYRQADYWCRIGYVRSDWRTTGRNSLPTDQGGHGRQRALTDLELEVLVTMARLVHAGLTIPVAARAARAMATSQRAIANIGPGVVVLLTDRPTPLPALTWQDTETNEHAPDTTDDVKEAV